LWRPSVQAWIKLLKANLTPSQLNEFLTYRRFDVVGGVSGRIYRIRLTGARNVEELDREGRCIRRLCFFPEGELVAGDVVLAQKVALETFETEALAIAQHIPAKPLTAFLLMWISVETSHCSDTMPCAPSRTTQINPQTLALCDNGLVESEVLGGYHRQCRQRGRQYPYPAKAYLGR
jgi:hypothetical protein